MNKAVMNKIDLLLESYLEEANRFGTQLDRRLINNSIPGQAVAAARKVEADEMRKDRAKVAQLRDEYKKTGLDYKLSEANSKNNANILATWNPKGITNESLRDQLMDQKGRPLNNNAYYHYISSNPRELRMPDKNHPLNNPNTPYFSHDNK